MEGWMIFGHSAIYGQVIEKSKQKQEAGRNQNNGGVQKSSYHQACCGTCAYCSTSLQGILSPYKGVYIYGNSFWEFCYDIFDIF